MTTPLKPDHEKRPFRFKLEGPFLRVSTMLLITPISPNFKGLKCSVFGRFRALQSRKIYGIIESGDEKMMERGKMDRDLVEFVVIDQLVPKEHLLRKIDAAVDFTRLYEMVEPLYCEDNGRPSIDPVVLFKMVLIQHLYGLPSLRRTAEEVSANNCYRWFLGYPLQEETPHFSTVSYNFRHRFTEETVDRVFAWILDEVAKAGYLSPKAVFIDGTHIKANANTKKQMKEQIPAAARHYAKELMEEVNADREAHGKKPFDDDNDPPASPKKHKDNTSKKKRARRKKQGFRTVTKSTTDSDCGLFIVPFQDKCCHV